MGTREERLHRRRVVGPQHQGHGAVGAALGPHVGAARQLGQQRPRLRRFGKELPLLHRPVQRSAGRSTPAAARRAGTTPRGSRKAILAWRSQKTGRSTPSMRPTWRTRGRPRPRSSPRPGAPAPRAAQPHGLDPPAAHLHASHPSGLRSRAPCCLGLLQHVHAHLLGAEPAAAPGVEHGTVASESAGKWRADQRGVGDEVAAVGLAGKAVERRGLVGRLARRAGVVAHGPAPRAAASSAAARNWGILAGSPVA